ncbi:Alpha/Beta hydrolase protein [Cunninghamella echinulata]|nr:Alpha/Beta hydrolase protein [Cunninghamella echinulata]
MNNNDKRSNDTISTKVDTGVSIASQEQVNSAYFFAELSANAYCRQVVPLGIWFCPHCKSSVSDAKIEKTFFSLLSDTNGYIITSASQKAIFLAFRGTNSIRSAITDLNFVLSAYPPIKGAKVHPGFYNSYIEVQKTVLNTMDSLLKKYPGYRVDVTGHSLGGAQAELATLDLFQRFQQLTPDNLRLYTVGQPRVGNPNYAAYFLSTKIGKIRTVHESDLVPHLPPMASGYLHTGTEYWVKDDDTKLTQICEATYESASCSNTLVPFLSILDHLSCYNINEGLCL